MKITRYFKFEKETKNTIRLQELTEDKMTGKEESPECGTAIGPVYIQKEALKALDFGEKDVIKITIEKD